jgi:meso-butanediol dehydrogenase/(S,S)-butanediol dehydrogenase/diacetyl reductase
MADVLISGAAGGIGSETARAFGERSWRVLSLDRISLPTELASTLSPVPLSFSADLTDDHSLLEATGQIKEEANDLCHLVGIAGGALDRESKEEAQGQLPDISLFRSSIELNLTSQWHLLEQVLPLLEKSAASGQDCSVTFVSSINALASYGLIGYSAAKAGLIGLMHSLCGPLGAKGIRVNVVAPGSVPTARTISEWEHDPGHFERLDKTAALLRCGTPEQIASTLRAVALDLTHITGQVIVADGGQMIKRGW